MAASRLGLSETVRGQLAIISTELGNNLIKHTQGKGGRLVFRPLGPEEGGGLELLSLDQGPGMADVARCLEDGYSTAGSPGTGLGAVSRLSGVFDVHSIPGAGTAILSRVLAQAGPPPEQSDDAFEVGTLCLPIQGETVSGDAVEVRLRAGLRKMIVADGLGHGPQACHAAQEATRSFRDNPFLSSAELIQAVHQALRSTRGAAVAVAHIDTDSGLVHYSGLGNISGMVFSSTGLLRRMVSHNGTAGLQIRKVQEFTYPWDRDSVLIMHSDGLTSQWSLEKYPGLMTRHPALIAGVLFRDFSRGRDDVSVLVVARRKRTFSWQGAA
jgi:anti-sigma regulatory factor (Ser/Thr protein kinase)